VHEQAFTILPYRQYRELLLNVGLSLGTLAPGSNQYQRTTARRRGRLAGPDVLSPVLSDARREPGRWEVLVRHPVGSLRTAFDQRRRRGILLTVGIFGLIGATAVLLVVSTQRAHRLAKQQIEFVASVSHELRTPLSVIRMAARNLERGAVRDDDVVRRYAALIGSEELRLTEMVERVLAFGKMQPGETIYSMQPVSIRSVIDAALADTRLLIQERGAEVETTLSSEELTAMGDPDALRQAVQNLVANAVKHSGETPRVSVEAKKAASGRRRDVMITVRDSGAGIPKDDMAHIFEPFYRGRQAIDDQIQGSGLGLTLVKEIIEAHGGRVTVKSDDAGSAFTVHLRAGESTDEEQS